MAIHEETCPACGSALLVSVSPHLGGSVEENVSVSLTPSADQLRLQRMQAVQTANEAQTADLSQRIASAKKQAQATLAKAESDAAAAKAALVKHEHEAAEALEAAAQAAAKRVKSLDAELKASPKGASDPTKLGPGEEWDATDAATKHAAATGVDIGPIKGTGTGGTVTKADVTAAAEGKASA